MWTVAIVQLAPTSYGNSVLTDVRRVKWMRVTITDECAPKLGAHNRADSGGIVDVVGSSVTPFGDPKRRSACD